MPQKMIRDCKKSQSMCDDEKGSKNHGANNPKKKLGYPRSAPPPSKPQALLGDDPSMSDVIDIQEVSVYGFVYGSKL